MFLGLDWLDPDWLLSQFGTQLFWVSLAIIFVECGLFFPFLPGDGLLFAIGIFVATGQLDILPWPPVVDLTVIMAALIVAAFLGNVTGFEIGRKIGPRLYQRDGRILKRRYFDQTRAFFDRHGPKALVIGRFLAFVRTYVTVVAGVTLMDRQRFFRWSFIGAALWVLSITLLGYFLGTTVPWMADNIDYVIIGIAFVGFIPMTFEYLKQRRESEEAETESASKAEELPN